MKKYLFTTMVVFALIIANTQTYAQSPQWLWAKSGEGLDEEYPHGISTDASGNVYIIGEFRSDSVAFGSTTLINNGLSFISDVFITKYDSTGNVLWAKAISDGGSGYDVATDAGGNVYVTGAFGSDSIAFDSIVLVNPFFGSIFLAKYDSNGNVIWAKSVGSTYSCAAISISNSPGGYIYITGVIQGVTTFGSTVLTTVNGFQDIFIAKYDSNGTVLWAKSAGGAKDEFGWAISTDTDGNAFITGQTYSDTITFGSITLTNGGGNSLDFFIAKYDSSGNALWAKISGGTGGDRGYGIAADPAGNVYVTGEFNSDSITFSPYTLVKTGVGDLFLVKYDVNGTVLWAKREGNGYADANSVCTDAGGNVYITGIYASASITFGTISLSNEGDGDFFVTKYDSNGTVIWAKGAGGLGYEVAFGVATDTWGGVYMTGLFRSDSINFGSTLLTNPGSPWTYDVVTAKLNNGITGIEEKNLTTEINIYPNPFSSEFTVRSLEKINQIIIYDLMGETVYQQELTSNKTSTELNLSFLQQGIYFLNVKTGGESYTKKIIRM